MLREQPQHPEQSCETEDAQDHQNPHSPPRFIAYLLVRAQASDDGVGDARGERHRDDAKVQNVEPRLAAEEYLWLKGEYPAGAYTFNVRGVGGPSISRITM